jgi:hypothetical protein
LRACRRRLKAPEARHHQRMELCGVGPIRLSVSNGRQCPMCPELIRWRRAPCLPGLRPPGGRAGLSGSTRTDTRRRSRTASSRLPLHATGR